MDLSCRCYFCVNIGCYDAHRDAGKTRRCRGRLTRVLVSFCDMFADSVYLYVISHDAEEIVDKFLFDESSKKLMHQRRIVNEPDFIA